jgi:hypothetical protein
MLSLPSIVLLFNLWVLSYKIKQEKELALKAHQSYAKRVKEKTYYEEES